MSKIVNKLGLVLVLAGLAGSCKTPQVSWKLAWQDEFDQTSGFDTTVWSKIPRGTPDWQNYMSDYDGLYEVNDGKLILRGRVNDVVPDDTASFLTGGVYTMNKKLFEYGRMEIRARLFGATGAWPAFWMLPQDKGWPDGGEIDIMERLNDDDFAYQTVHTHYTYTLGIKDPPTGSTAPISKDEYNVYGVEIWPDSLRFFINDVHNFTYPRIETEQEGQFPFGSPFYLLLDMQLGGSWVGAVDPNDLPVEMWIDWVRWYEPK